MDRAGSRVVVVGSGETVDGTGHGIVEVLDASRRDCPRSIEKAWVLRELPEGFAPETLQKMPVVDASEAALEGLRPLLEAKRTGPGRRGAALPRHARGILS